MVRSQVRQLMLQIHSAQQRLLWGRFVAPCLPPVARLRVRVAGLVHSFHCSTHGFEGWGVFRPLNPTEAILLEEAPLSAVEGYLARCQVREMRLLRPLRWRTWLAHPVHEGGGPAVVHLVEEGTPWRACRAAFDGCSWWYAGLARRADPRLAEQLLGALHSQTEPRALRLPGLTPADRRAYSIEFLHRYPPVTLPRVVVDPAEAQLQRALARGGGELCSYQDQLRHWLVHWMDSQGDLHTSTIRKDDLGVVSAGVCLSGHDEKFDLTSLVGVVEGFE